MNVVQLWEHYVTLFDSDADLDKKEYYLDQVWDILTESYKAIGGMANVSEPEELLNDEYVWKLFTRNKKVLAVQLYKLKGGSRKLFLGGCLATPEGKEAFYKMAAEDVKRLERGAWAEVSGSMEGVYIFKLGATPIPADVSKKILNDMGKDVISVDKDGFHYTRKIGGKPYEKIMFGNVPKKYRVGDWDEVSQKYKDIYKNYTETHPDEVAQRKAAHRNKR